MCKQTMCCYKLKASALFVAFFLLFNTSFGLGIFISTPVQQTNESVLSKKSDSPVKSGLQLLAEEEEKEGENETDDLNEKDDTSSKTVKFHGFSPAPLCLHYAAGISVVRVIHKKFARHVPLFLANRSLLI